LYWRSREDEEFGEHEQIVVLDDRGRRQVAAGRENTGERSDARLRRFEQNVALLYSAMLSLYSGCCVAGSPISGNAIPSEYGLGT
jgi:hypothetical protein